MDNEYNWEGSKNYEYCVHDVQPSTELFGTVLSRLRIRRSAKLTIEVVPDDGQRLTIQGEKWMVVMCCREARIFYVWVNRGNENYMALAKDVTAAEPIPSSFKREAEDLRIKVTCFV